MFEKISIPDGLNDLLPEEVIKRRFLERKISEVFKKWGYREIITPSFEFYEVLSKGAGIPLKKEMIKFFDREGNIVAFRPEMTTPIARISATKLKNEPKPLRFWYTTNVFRYDSPQMGNRREFTQSGVELIGVKTKETDAEVIALAIECLKNAGLKKFLIDVSHIDFFNGIMKSIKVEENEKQEIKKAIIKKDFVLLEKILSLANLKRREKELILNLFSLRGGEEVLEKAASMVNNKFSISALKKLKEVYNILRDYGLKEYISIDMGIIRDFDYYTGIIFEGYTDYLGFPVCGGGRYDNLCYKFGEDLPATGFAIGLERLALALEKEDSNSLKINEPLKYLICYKEGYLKSAFELAQYLRKKGLRIEVEVLRRNLNDALLYASSKEIKYLIMVDSKIELKNKIKVIDVLSKKEKNKIL
ncbi:ATP phosphoribosyltransferase regulatory subunit [Candidatus Aerophobetes bacterium]|nr:ATP phosphoribosyltransferase regulatory subunit [Candidatus Aerophobetes bacterium]